MAILSATRYEWPIIDFAILSVGAVTVPIYETSSAEQVQFVLADSGAVAVFAETDAHAGRIEQLRAELPELRKVYCIEGAGTAAARRTRRSRRDGRRRRGRRAGRGHQVRRPGDADLHLGHDRAGPRAAS